MALTSDSDPRGGSTTNFSVMGARAVREDVWSPSKHSSLDRVREANIARYWYAVAALVWVPMATRRDK